MISYANSLGINTIKVEDNSNLLNQYNYLDGFM